MTDFADYPDIDFDPPQGVVEEAQRGLAWVDEHGRGGTQVGRTTAGLLVSGRPLAPRRVRRMAAYFPRHEVDKEAEGWRPGETGYPSNGRIAWALWGGDAGRTWSRRKVVQMNRADDEKRSVTPETKDLVLTGPATLDDGGTVKGVAAAFGNLDRHGDIILPGAFDRFMNGLSTLDDVAFLWNHDTSMPLGKLTKLGVTPEGLGFEAQIVPTTWGKDVQLLLDTGTIQKMSFGYRVDRAAFVDDAVGLASAMAHFGVRPEWSTVITREAAKAFDAGTGVRLLVDLDPWEVSLVPVPANPRAELAKGITLDEAKGAAPFRDYAFAPLDTKWDADNAQARVKRWAEADEGANAAYRSAFAWYDTSNAGEFGAYRLPIADIVDNKIAIVPGAVFAAAASVEQGTSGVPDNDLRRVKQLLARYYAAMRSKFAQDTILAPWEVTDADKGLTGVAQPRHNALDLLDDCAPMFDEAKAGRVISGSNLKRLQTLRSALTDGMKALDEVLRLAGAMQDDEDDDSKEAKPGHYDDHDDADAKAAPGVERATVESIRHLFRFT